MFRWVIAGTFVGALAVVPVAARAQTEQQALVDRATLAVQEMAAEAPPDADVRKLLQNAKAVMVCPRVFKAGFILGGQGGGCVLSGRGPSGWSGPAFYGLGTGSVGLQIGIQDSELMLIVLTDKGFRAFLDSQFKLGAGASLAFANVGAGVEGATTGAFDADIVAFQNNRGLFAGLSLEGTLIGARSEWNQAYYGQPLAAQQIVMQMQGQNPGAGPLQDMLGRLSGATGTPYAQAPQAPQTPPPYGAPYPQPYQAPYQPPAVPPSAAGGGIQATPLPPPPHR